VWTWSKRGGTIYLAGQKIEHVNPLISESDVGDLKSAEAAPYLGGNAAMVGHTGSRAA
jgi:hypothetical protein